MTTEPAARPARCMLVIGSRKDAINLFPVVQAMRRSSTVDPYVVFAGGSDAGGSIPAQRLAHDDASVLAGDSVTHAFAELAALARTPGSPPPTRRGQRDW